MRYRLLGTLVLLLAIASLAQADYVVFIYNLTANPDGSSSSGGGAAGGGGMTGSGFGGGMAGSGFGGGMAGSGFGGGMAGSGFGGGMAGSGFGGAAPGMMGGMPAPGMMGGAGAMGGFVGGPAPGGGGDADESPYFVVAVLDVGVIGSQRFALFKKGQPMNLFYRVGGVSGTLPVLPKTNQYQVIPLTVGDGTLLPSVRARYQAKYDQTFKTKPTADQVLALARWSLEHGLLDDFGKVMDKAAEIDKTKPAVTAFEKVRADLARPVGKVDVAGWKNKLLDGYKFTQSDAHHFALIHNNPNDTVAEVKPQLDRLEKTYRSFFYWWALSGVTVPMPTERLVAIQTDRADDFRRLRTHLTASPVMADSFHARREGVSVFSAKRMDDQYVTLDRVSKPQWDAGYNRFEIIKGKGTKGAPKGADPNVALDTRTRALLMKALEEEWEATGISHEASRQLIYATGMLPKNVHAPEWIQFGLGSFFEIPLQSPWGGVGAPNPYYLPRFKENNTARRYGNTPAEQLAYVVTDTGFRRRPSPGTTAETQLRRARAASWALTYYLMHREQVKLRAYFKELSRLPRDVELDDRVLLECFARAFDCLNPDQTISDRKMTDLATRWLNFTNTQVLEAEGVHKTIRAHFAQMTRSPSRPATGNPGTGLPGFPFPGMGGNPGPRPGGAAQPPRRPGGVR